MDRLSIYPSNYSEKKGLEDIHGQMNNLQLFDTLSSPLEKANSEIVENNPSYFSHLNSILKMLPFNQVQKSLFNYLDIESKLNFRLVCKQWEEMVNGTINFNPILCDATAGEIINNNSTKSIHKLTVCDFKIFQYQKSEIGFIGLKKLIITNSAQLPGESKWIEGRISYDNLQKILKQFNYLQSLEIWGKAMPSNEKLSFFKSIKLPNLQELKINCDTIHPSNFCAQLLQNAFPNLRSIFIEFGGTNIKGNEQFYVDPFYTEIFCFIGRHFKTLDEVNIYREDIETDEEIVAIRVNELQEEDKKLIAEQLKQVQLSTFDYSRTLCDLLLPFCNELFGAQTKLTKLYLGNIQTNETGLWSLLPQVLEKCSQTLKNLTICGTSENNDIFSCFALANCSKMETFCFEMERVQVIDMHYLPAQIKKLELPYVTLKAGQIHFIASELVNLEMDFLFLAQKDRDRNNDRITLRMFKKLLKMPKLVELIIDRKSSDLTMISTWITFWGQGCIKLQVRTPGESFFDVTIDRERFKSSRIFL